MKTDSTVHLFRGAPPVRSWSQYQQTVRERTLCGIDRSQPSPATGKWTVCVEIADEVTCPHCLELMRAIKLPSRVRIRTRPAAAGSRRPGRAAVSS